MTAEFERDVLPVIVKYARKVFGQDDEKVSIAMDVGWYYWSIRQDDYPPSVYARLATRNVKNGRDLPGVQDSKFRDIWDALPHWNGAGMGEVMDKRPGPDALAVAKEEYEIFLAGCNEQEAKMVELIEQDRNIGTNEIARILERSPGRISQMRREMMDRTK